MDRGNKMNYTGLKKKITGQLADYLLGKCDWDDLPTFITDIVREEDETEIEKSNLIDALFQKHQTNLGKHDALLIQGFYKAIYEYERVLWKKY